MRHNKLVVVLDHMYMKNNFVTLMFTLKVGKQSIPIWFKCDKTKSNRHYEIDELTKKCLFSEKVIFNAINEVIELLSPLNAKITFLADRNYQLLTLTFLSVFILTFIVSSSIHFIFSVYSFTVFFWASGEIMSSFVKLFNITSYDIL